MFEFSILANENIDVSLVAMLMPVGYKLVDARSISRDNSSITLVLDRTRNQDAVTSELLTKKMAMRAGGYIGLFIHVPLGLKTSTPVPAHIRSTINKIKKHSKQYTEHIKYAMDGDREMLPSISSFNNLITGRSKDYTYKDNKIMIGRYTVEYCVAKGRAMGYIAYKKDTITNYTRDLDRWYFNNAMVNKQSIAIGDIQGISPGAGMFMINHLKTHGIPMVLRSGTPEMEPSFVRLGFKAIHSPNLPGRGRRMVWVPQRSTDSTGKDRPVYESW